MVRESKFRLLTPIENWTTSSKMWAGISSASADRLACTSFHSKNGLGILNNALVDFGEEASRSERLCRMTLRPWANVSLQRGPVRSLVSAWTLGHGLRKPKVSFREETANPQNVLVSAGRASQASWISSSSSRSLLGHMVGIRLVPQFAFHQSTALMFSTTVVPGWATILLQGRPPYPHLSMAASCLRRVPILERVVGRLVWRYVLHSRFAAHPLGLLMP